MSIKVTVRHMSAPDAKVYAQDKAEKLLALFPRIEHIHIILNVEKHRYEAEVVVQAKNHVHVEASETNDDILVAIDVAVDRTERQLRKLRDKIQSHRVRGGDTAEPLVD